MNTIQIDQEALVWLNHALVGRSAFLDKLIVFLGVYLIYALPVVLILLWFFVKKQQRTLAFSFFGTLISWLVITKSIVPHIWFRARPDFAAIGARELIFHRPDYSFPSDHATALFAITFGLYLFGYRKAANWFLLGSIVICIARVTLGIHFPLDIIGGIVSAAIGVALVKMLEGPLDKYIWRPFSRFLKTIYLT